MLLLLLQNLQSASVAPIQAPPPAAAFGNGGGPDAQLSLSDYLKKFGTAHTPPTPPTATMDRKKRQRMEEEVLHLCKFF